MLVVVILVRVVVFWTSLGLATVVLLRADGEAAATGSALGFVVAGAAAASRALTSQLRVDTGR